MKTPIVKRWIAVPLVIAAVAGTVIGTKLLIDSNLTVKAGEGDGSRGDLKGDAASDRDGNGVSKNESGGRGNGDLQDDVAAGSRDGNGVSKGEGGRGGGNDLKNDAARDRDGNGVSKNEGGKGND